jgi:PAS domain S-box-containing protein
MAYSLAFAEDELAFEMFDSMKDKLMEEQLRISQSQLRSVEHPEQPVDRDPLPRTFRELRSPTSRPIVVTDKDMPFSIVEVNQAWEGLCGYGYAESHGKSLGTLLQGPETNMASVTAMMSQLLRGEEAGTVITNYTKDGRRFRNRLRVGPLVNDAGETTHFVGVLQEIQDGM